MTKSKQNRNQPPPSPSVEALIARYRETEESVVGSGIFSKIEDAAAATTDAALTEIDTQVAALERLQERLTSLKVEVIETDAKWQMHFRYTDDWWQQELAILATFQKGDESFKEHWFERFVQALLDWRFDVCQRLGEEVLGLAPESIDESMLDVVFRAMFAVSAIENDDYSKDEVITTLDELLRVHLGEEHFAAQHRQLRMQLMLFIGRIYLYRRGNRAEAERYFVEAAELTPVDGRPQAALGHYYLEDDNLTRAHRAFVSAMNLSPDEPDGFVGLALLADEREEWAEATSWLNRAIESVADRPDPAVALTKCLSPVSGNLYQHLAQHFVDVEAYQQAFDAASRSLENEPQDGSEYPLRHAYALQAVAGEKTGRQREATNAYYEGAMCHFWLGNFEEAVEGFEKTIALATGDSSLQYQSAYFYLADALRIQSVSLEPSYRTDPVLLQRSLDMWNAGAGIGPIPAESAWAYFARSTLEDLWSNLPEVERRMHLWQAVSYAEIGYLFDSAMRRRTALATALRTADLDSNALFLADDVDVATEDADQLQAFIGSKLNTGEINGLEPYLERLLALTESDEITHKYYQGWHVFYHYVAGNFTRSSEIAEQWFETDTDDIWERELRAFTNLHAGHRSVALEDYEWLWARRKPEDVANQRLYGLAGLVLGHVAETVPYFERSTTEPTDRFSSWLMLGIAQITLGDTESAVRSFDNAFSQLTTKRTLSTALLDLTYFSQDMEDPNQAEMLSTIKQRVDERLGTIGNDAGDPLRELDNYADEVGETHSAGWMAIQWTRGRLHTTRGNWSVAAQTYITLRDDAEIPEAQHGINNVASGLRNQARQQLANNDEIQHLLTLADDLGLMEGTTGDGLEWQAIDALSALINGQTERSAERFRSIVDSLAALETDDATDPLGILGDTTRTLLPDIESYWLVHELWQSLGTRFQEPLNRLHLYLSDYFGLSPSKWQPGQYAPIVTPLVVEVSNTLVPDDTSEEWPLFKHFIPEMRDRVKTDMGVNLPGVRIRGNEGDMPPDSYLIMFDEVPLILQTVYPGHIFCDRSTTFLANLGIPTEDTKAASHPITLHDGAWVAARHTQKLDELNCLRWDDPYLYITHHLEAILRTRLHEFVTLQELEELSAGWKDEESGAGLVESALPDESTRIRFVRLIRQLLVEGVSIGDWRTLLEAVEEIGLPIEDSFTSLEQVRIALKPYLPGNQPDDTRLPLPAELETLLLPGLHLLDDQQFFALAPEPTQDFLNQFRTFVGTQSNVVIVVENGKLRPHLRTLLQLEFPYISVISQAEALAPESIADTRVDQHEPDQLRENPSGQGGLPDVGE